MKKSLYVSTTMSSGSGGPDPTKKKQVPTVPTTPASKPKKK